jgi:hypothetical protein
VVHTGWALAGVYIAGVVLGLLMSDAQPAQRFVLAVLWPLGPIAFAVTASVLLVAAVIAFPLVIGPALAGVVLVVWLLW